MADLEAEKAEFNNGISGIEREENIESSRNIDSNLETLENRQRLSDLEEEVNEDDGLSRREERRLDRIERTALKANRKIERKQEKYERKVERITDRFDRKIDRIKDRAYDKIDRNIDAMQDDDSAAAGLSRKEQRKLKRLERRAERKNSREEKRSERQERNNETGGDRLERRGGNTGGGVMNIGANSREIGPQNPHYDGFLDAFSKGGVVGTLDNLGQMSNMTPGQRKFWRGTATLGVTAGLIWGGWKVVSGAWDTIWKLPTDGIKAFNTPEGKRALGGIGAVLGAQMSTGKNPRTLLSEVAHGGSSSKYIAGIFGDKMTSPNTPTDQKEYIYYPAATIGILGNIPVGHLKQYAILKNGNDGNFSVDRTKLLEYMKANGNKKGIRLVEKLSDSDLNSAISQGLNKMGITVDSMSTMNQDESILKSGGEYLKKSEDLRRLMSEKNYEIKEDKKDLINEYVAGKKTLAELESEGVFEVESVSELIIDDVEDKLNIGAKISDAIDVYNNPLTLMSKKKIVEEVNRLSNKTHEAIDIKVSGQKINVISYGQTISLRVFSEGNIVISDARVGSFKNTFSSPEEAIRGANLTNFLKSKFQGKGDNENPFYRSLMPTIGTGGFGRDLLFDNKSFSEYEIFETDTKIMAGGRRSDLSTLSDTIDDNKSDYVDWLNSFGIWKKGANGEGKNTGEVIDGGDSKSEITDESNETPKPIIESENETERDKRIDEYLDSIKGDFGGGKIERKINGNTIEIGSGEDKISIDILNKKIISPYVSATFDVPLSTPEEIIYVGLLAQNTIKTYKETSLDIENTKDSKFFYVSTIGDNIMFQAGTETSDLEVANGANMFETFNTLASKAPRFDTYHKHQFCGRLNKMKKSDGTILRAKEKRKS